MNNQRQERVNSQFKTELADLLRRVKDPRIGFVSVTDVEVTPDLKQARVYVSVLGNEDARRDTLSGLRSATGFIKTELARRVRLRFMPDIEWRYDSSIEHGARINELLNQVKRSQDDSGTGDRQPDVPPAGGEPKA
ncbi:MAG: 30S ribosome-binding factor RbfA [Chloroflexota bacterium]